MASASGVSDPRTSSRVELPDRLKSEVSEALGIYVYALVDPRDDAIFYVGKGKDSRFIAHEREAVRRLGTSSKSQRIRDILDAGLTPRVDIIRHALPDERTAFLIERVLIDALGGRLANAVAGHDAARVPLDELKVRYAAPTLLPEAPSALIIRLRQWRDAVEAIEPGYIRAGYGWRNGMTLAELADSTRAWWRVSTAAVNRRGVRHAVAVAHGITRGVFAIGDWIGPRADGRRAFHASPVVTGPAFDAYVGDVGKRLPAARGSQNPVTYWPM